MRSWSDRHLGDVIARVGSVGADGLFRVARYAIGVCLLIPVAIACAVSLDERGARAFEAAQRQGPKALSAFLEAMPKGGDLHVHLDGAVYAESWLRAAAEDGLCADTTALLLVRPAATACDQAISQIPVAELLEARADGSHQATYDALIDAMSMRHFVSSSERSGHDHFFDTFRRFGAVSRGHLGEWLDEVATRAARQNEQYLELMTTPPFREAATLGRQMPWDPDLAALRRRLLVGGITAEVAMAAAEIDAAQAMRHAREHCGDARRTPACDVEVRFLYQVLRGFPKEQVFAQLLLGFETVSRVPGYVGINLVMPEDGEISMADYSLQMRMIGYLHTQYPKVHLSLHAGELAPWLVPPEGLRSHIREAVLTAHAERIGHGVDIRHEEASSELLSMLARRRVLVEVNLTSNDVILGVTGDRHPLRDYLAAGVPVALSTDDEGVSRIDLTHENLRAVSEFGLGYADLKQMARASLQYSFLNGASLWTEGSQPQIAAVCAAGVTGGDRPTAGCRHFLAKSPKATAQWELERRFWVFEEGLARH